MKIGRNAPCPCGSGKKYKKCCLNKETDKSIDTDFLRTIPSEFPYIKQNASLIAQIISKYRIEDVIIAAFSINAWRQNRSALPQTLTINMAICECTEFGNIPIESYEDFCAFYNELSSFLCITGYEDYTVDDFGEVFIEFKGETFPVVIGTGHEQVYAAIRFLTTLVSITNREDEFLSLLRYVEIIIDTLKEQNIYNADERIVFEIPSEAFWLSVKKLFASEMFCQQREFVSRVMGYQYGPIEMRHFVNKGRTTYPLYNTAILIDYYNCILKSASEKQIHEHVVLTVIKLIENSFNFQIDNPKVLVRPILWDISENIPADPNPIFFAAIEGNTLLIAIDEAEYEDDLQISDMISTIKKMHRNSELNMLESFHRKYGNFGMSFDQEIELVFIIVEPYTNISEPHRRLEENDGTFRCTSLDLLYFLGFSNDIRELIDFVKYDLSEEANVFTVGGKSNLFFAWKRTNHNLVSGAIEYNFISIDYNETEDYVYSFFADTLCNFPSVGYMFTDPLNWIVENSAFNYDRITHKSRVGFGGDIKLINNTFWVFFAHNVRFFDETYLSNNAQTTLLIIDELNQRCFDRYADLLSGINILKGKILELLFIPLNYAEQHDYFDSEQDKRLVLCNEYIDGDTIIIRYSVKEDALLDAIRQATTRKEEIEYFVELLSPLKKYSINEFEDFHQKVYRDAGEKKTVGVFIYERTYFFSVAAIDTEISAESFSKVRKEIARVCFKADVEPGIYSGKAATTIVRQMQTAATKVFENLVSQYDREKLHCMTLNYYSIQLNGIIVNMQRYASFKDLDPTIQLEFEENTIHNREDYRRYARTALYLLENNLCHSHIMPPKVCEKNDFNYLLAFADWLVTLQDAADTCYYTDFELSIEVDEEFRVNTEYLETAEENLKELISRKYKSKDYQIKNDEIDKEFLLEAIDAFSKDTGIDLELLLTLIDYLQLGVIEDGYATEVYPNVFEIDKNILAKKFNEGLVKPYSELDKIVQAIEFITLDETQLKRIKNDTHEILPIWEREKRDNRFDVKPIICREDICLFSPVTMNALLKSWKNGILEWFIPYEIGLPALKKVLTLWKKRYEDAMVQDINLLFKMAGFEISIPEVDLSKRFPNDNYPPELGDYDVIAINRSRKEIWIIESKVLQKVGSIFEDQMQQKSFFSQHRFDEKFQRRIDFMKENSERVLHSFSYEDATGYSVVPYMVTNKLFLSRYKKLQFPIITYSELEDILLQ